MVPLKISLKNFLSYGSTTQSISFEPYNLICLSGKNGHGKSALLDALTWALWGQARKTATSTRADENLIRLGQTQMMVCLEFMCNKTIYRVRRELNLATHKIQTSLDFGIVDPQTHQIRSLTDKTIRATQEKINSTLGLDYESFINSVFLRQGASNEFSKKSPKERKEILCSLLGITQFELIKKRAIDKGRAITAQKETLLPIHERISAEILHKEKLVMTLDHALEQEKKLFAEQQLLEETLKQAEATQQMIIRDTLILKEADDARVHLKQRLTNGIEELRTCRTEFKTIISKKRIAFKEPIHSHQALEQELEELTLQEAAHLLFQQEWMRINNLRQQQEAIIQTAHTAQLHALDINLQQLYVRREMHKNRINELSKKIASLQQTIHDVSGGDNAPDLIKKYEKYRESYQHFITKKNNLLVKLEEYEYHLKKLTTETEAQCPTCHQALEQPQKEILCFQQTKSQSRTKHTLERLYNIIPQLKQQVIDLHARVEKIKSVIHIEKQITDLRLEQQQLSEESTRDLVLLEKHQQEKAALVKIQSLIFENDPEYKKLTSTLDTLKAQLTIFSPKLQERKRTIIQEIKLSKLEADIRPETLTPLLQQIKKNTHVIISHLRTVKKELYILNEKIISLHKSIGQAAACEENLKIIRLELAQNNQKKNVILREIGSYKEQLSRIELQEKECARLATTLQEYTYGQQLYQSIAQAVGKDGIQALLIEQALPEIELEANALLQKLTDNQAHLFIESLRDLKSGKTKETLDIHISDATGVRAYELFSGGEAFRIDFALRIALSKLLARRAGTSLQTLIIDEGFGSQDEEGLAHIMDALYKIQDDFAKIIIVSHLPYMKDQFPVHFVIQKSAQGSQVKIVEQG